MKLNIIGRQLLRACFEIRCRCSGGSVSRRFPVENRTSALRRAESDETESALHRSAATTATTSILKHALRIFVGVLGLLLVVSFTSCSKADHNAPVASQHAAKYHCPMHPQIVSDKSGSCSICGMDLVPIKVEQPLQKKTRYRSTMNPNEVSDKPGKDSMGMEMAPFEVTAGGSATTPAGLSTITIPSETRQRIGLMLGMVEKHPLAREIRTAARIVADETRLYHVTLKTEGWIEHFHSIFVGKFIQQGEPLMKIYSPELLTAQREFLNAAQSGNSNLITATRRRLELLDVTADQIASLAHTNEPERTVTLYAPTSGYVVERNIAAGHKVMPGEMLLTLADLSVVWADAAIYESDLPLIKVGMLAEVTVNSQIFTGKVTFVSPTIDPDSRTMKARLEIANPNAVLKPEMFGTARLQFDLGEKLAIPAAAVMRTGERVYAFRDGGEGRLEPVEIKLGARADGWFEVLAGLAVGDKVVTSANFLVDSESQLHAALAGVAH